MHMVLTLQMYWINKPKSYEIVFFYCELLYGIALVADNFSSIHNNARIHASSVLNDYLDEGQLQKLDWPPRSPDPNPIEEG